MARFDAEPQIVVRSASGNRLVTGDGRSYIDGVASLWANVHGHSHPHIVEAIKRQTDQLQHSTLLGLTHEPAIELAERLLPHLPRGLTRVFMSENGASAVEVSLKMAIQYWANKGQPQRTRIVALRAAYHGDTIGAVAVGAEGPFRDVYAPLLFDPLRFDNGHRYRCEDGCPGPGCEGTCVPSIEELLEIHGPTVAAVIVEPRVQGAGGMLIQPEGHLARIRKACDDHDVLLIADEVATGFGKTGPMFACELEDVAPDIAILGKGITGGYLPLSATVTAEHVFEAFYGDDGIKLFHGHTYAGNPICCAAALASLDLFEQSDVLGQARARAELFRTLLHERFDDHPNVGDIRQQGLMVGLEIVADRGTREPFPAGVMPAWNASLAARDRDVFIRPLGDVMVLMPPLSIQEDELEQICEAVSYGLSQAIPTS